MVVAGGAPKTLFESLEPSKMLVVGLGNAPNGLVVLFALLALLKSEDDPKAPKDLASDGLMELKRLVPALAAVSGVLSEPKREVPALGAASATLDEPKRPVPALGTASGVLDEPKMLLPALAAA